MPTFVPARSARDAVLDSTQNVPQDIKRARKQVLDYLNTLGQPVVWKHKWTEDDVNAGRAQYCPYCRNVQYRQASQTDPNCFGTGFLGGFDDGVLVWMTFGDTTLDIFKLTREGVLIKDNHPQCSAPWEPTFSDGDLLLTCELAKDLWTITSLGDRYVAQETTPVTPRGTRSNTAGSVLYPVSQSFQADQLPLNHPYYAVPVLFDYSGLPAAPAVPPGGDPSDYGVGSISTYDLPVYLPVAPAQGAVTVTFT